MADVVNIAAYQFVPMSDLVALRHRLLAHCKSLGLRGTILISPEGINLFVAGSRQSIDSLLGEIRTLPGLEHFSPKISVSEKQPFRRMLVRIKKEIIAFGVPGIDPSTRTSPKLAPQELKRWLDEGRPITLLDTRNEYEVKLGTFNNAITLGLDHFRNFPRAVGQLPTELKQQPIVMFCTGGIRCEKAGPYMEREGFQNIFQLDGGILKYFEECGGAHYTGECFVFDQRVGLDPTLAETENTQCFNCLMPLTVADQQDPRYQPPTTCPYCFRSDAEKTAQTIVEREAAIAKATNPLPGNEPYDNYRPIKISSKFDGQPLLAALCQIFSHLDAEHWRERANQQLIVDAEYRPVALDRTVRSGEWYFNRMLATSEPDVNATIRILHEDEAIVVVNKPAPLPLHPSGRFNRNTLQWILNQVYHPEKLRPVHRLDGNTTGVIVLARTRHFAGKLQPQFAAGRVEKIYLARVQGHPPPDRFECDASISTGTTELGGRGIDAEGLAALTEFAVLDRFSDGTALVEARPHTGRTNQIRVHLWHLGWPVVGDQAYLPNQRMGETQTHRLGDPPLCLHALRITLEHPLTRERVTFESPVPDWARWCTGQAAAIVRQEADPGSALPFGQLP